MTDTERLDFLINERVTIETWGTFFYVREAEPDGDTIASAEDARAAIDAAIAIARMAHHR